MKKDDLIQSMLNEAEDIQIPELSERARMEPIATLPQEVKTTTRRHFRPLSVLTVMLMLVFGIGFLYSSIMKVETKVTIDINPSIELSLNAHDQVIAVRAYNDEGEEFIKHVDVVYKSLDEAVEDVINVACDLNYIKRGEQNAVLFSVKSLASGKASYHEDGLKSAFGKTIKARGISGNFCYSEYTSDDEVTADKRDVSPAKLAFIRQLLQNKYKRIYTPEQIPNRYLTQSVTQLIKELE